VTNKPGNGRTGRYRPGVADEIDHRQGRYRPEYGSPDRSSLPQTVRLSRRTVMVGDTIDDIAPQRRRVLSAASRAVRHQMILRTPRPRSSSRISRHPPTFNNS
jgi:hypothetical protein